MSSLPIQQLVASLMLEPECEPAMREFALLLRCRQALRHLPADWWVVIIRMAETSFCTEEQYGCGRCEAAATRDRTGRYAAQHDRSCGVPAVERIRLEAAR